VIGDELPPIPPGRFDDDEPETHTTNGVTNGASKSRPPIRLATGADPRPDILMVPEVHLTTEHMIRALEADPELYVRGGSLVHVIRPTETTPEVVAGSPVSRACPLSYLVDRTSIHARCVTKARKGDSWVTCPPPLPRVRAVLERGSWPGYRELKGIIEAPSLRPDGSLLDTPGHDRATGFLYEPNAKFYDVAPDPTQAEAAGCLEALAEVFCDFPYVGPAHLSAVLASLLTLLARPAIRGSVPCFLFDASAARSGKSLQVDVVHLIATGRAATRMTYPELDEELEKVLSGYAIRGASTVNFDNVARAFGGAALDKCITAIDTVDLRLLGASTMVTYDWRAVVFASGNNVSCRGDMLARVLSPRLESSADNPEQRDDFRHPNLRAWVLEHRPRLVHAALTILRGYVAAGRPDMKCARWGGFEAWAALIPHALVWAGAADPMGARRGLEGDDDPVRVASSALVDGWASMCSRMSWLLGANVRQALALLYPSRHPNEPTEPDGYDPLREALETLTGAKPGVTPGARQVGEALRRQKGRPFGGRKLIAEQVKSEGARWRVIGSG
jgi:hypothetical protein